MVPLFVRAGSACRSRKRSGARSRASGSSRSRGRSPTRCSGTSTGRSRSPSASRVIPGARVGAHLAIRSSDRALCDSRSRSCSGRSRSSTRSGEIAAAAVSARARVKTASIIGSVSLPVNVFCWLGWKQPMIVGPRGRHLDEVTEARARTGQIDARVAQRGPQRLVRRSAPSVTIDLHPVEQRELAVQVRPAAVAFGRRGLVRRRRAPHGRGDVGVVQLEPVVGEPWTSAGSRTRRGATTRTASRPSGRR